MPKYSIAKKNLPNQRQDLEEKFPRDAKSKKSIRPAPSNVSQTIEVEPPLSRHEAVAVSALRSLLQKKQKVVAISGAGMSVNTGSEFLPFFLVSRSLKLLDAKFRIFTPYESQREFS